MSETYHWLRSQWTKSTFSSDEWHVFEHVKNSPTRGGAHKHMPPSKRAVFNDSIIDYALLEVENG